MNDYVDLREDLSLSVPGSPFILHSARLDRALVRRSVAEDTPLATPLDTLYLELGDRSRLAMIPDSLHVDARILVPAYRIENMQEELSSNRVAVSMLVRDIKRAALLWVAEKTREEFLRIPRNISEIFCRLAAHDLDPLAVRRDEDYRERASWFFVRIGLAYRTPKPVSAPRRPEPAVQSSPTFQTPKRTITINKRR
ncbi:hypothetical protein JT27_18370 [Alcaligenes faecalis]|nr:hypothetical protein JT27_18370 [Alcaligenes faecalis]